MKSGLILTTAPLDEDSVSDISVICYVRKFHLKLPTNLFAEMIRKEIIVQNLRLGGSWRVRASEMILTKKFYGEAQMECKFDRATRRNSIYDAVQKRLKNS